MNINSLTKTFPKSKIQNFVPFWGEVSVYAEINTDERFAMFFAQVGHECQGFTRFIENLNYSAQGLANTWPSRFSISPNAKRKLPNALAINIARNPEMIANITYSGRMGNGKVESGDGWKFRGRGIIMTTGRENYTDLVKAFNVDFVSSPDLLLMPYWALMSAAHFWKRKNLNAFADRKDIQGTRKAINGGLIGVDAVEKLYFKILVSVTKTSIV